MSPPATDYGPALALLCRRLPLERPAEAAAAEEARAAPHRPASVTADAIPYLLCLPLLVAFLLRHLPTYSL